MEQATCSQPDIETIMRRLRGKETPYTAPINRTAQPMPSPSEAAELKTIVKSLGAKLKDAYKELSDVKGVLSALEQEKQALIQTAEFLQASLSTKGRDLTTAQNGIQQAQLTSERLEQELAELRAKKAVPQHSPELAILREELVSIRAEQVAWQEERKRLETALEQERQRVRAESSNTNGQLVRLAMSCKQLEEEVHSLTCERAATIRQFTQLKELNEQSQKELEEEKQKGCEKDEGIRSSTQTIQELLGTIEKNKSSIAALTDQAAKASQRETELLAQIELSETSLVQQKAANESLGTSLKAANESFRTLSAQLEQERRTFHETDEKCMLLQKEKEAADSRVKEVEELLIIKLQTITDLEEQLGEALTHGEDAEHKASTLEQALATLREDLQKTTEARDELHEKTLKLEQQLGRTAAENAELKKRTEAFERLKKSIAEASSHAHAILRALDPAAKPPLAISNLVEELSIKPQEQEQSLFEEQFEQHELF
jgi:chromosome segregation ATPase